MFSLERLSELRQAGWNLPQATIENEEIQRWFTFQEELSQSDANFHQETGQELGKGALWTGGGTLALSYFFPPIWPITAVGLLCTGLFGTGCAKETLKKNSLLDQHRIVTRTKGIWSACQRDIAYLNHLKKDIQSQCQELQEATNPKLPEVLAKTRAKWNAFQSKVNVPNQFKGETKSLRRNGKSIVQNLKAIDTNSIKLREKKAQILNLLQECIQKNGTVDTLIQSREQRASAVLYEAVDAREADLRNLIEHGASVKNIPAFVTDGKGGIKKL